MPLLLLDRDGTLIADPGYLRDAAGVTLIPGAAAAVRHLVYVGFTPAVVSNQSGLARGLIAPSEADAVHTRFVQLFAEASGVTLPCWYCPHGPGHGCDCRKPLPGLLKQAASVLNLTHEPGVMVGDKPSDVDAGRAAGYHGLLFRGDWASTLAEISALFPPG